MPDKSKFLTDDEVTGMIRQLVEEGVIHEPFYDLLCRLSYVLLQKRILAGVESISEESHTLALEFIMHLRDKQKSNILSVYQVQHELKKYLTQRDSPVNYEVWKILSRALKNLEKEGIVERVAGESGVNRQSTAWCLTQHATNSPAKLELFFDAAASLPVYHPARKDGRLLAPSQARELVVKMLELAGGAILMQDLHAEALKHVVPPMLFAQSLDEAPAADDGDAAPRREVADRAPVIGFMLEEEAVERANIVWDRLQESGDGKVLCIYFIPRHLLGRSVKQSELGAPQRVSEAVSHIREVFQDVLDLSPLLEERREAADGVANDPLSMLVSRMMEVLMKFCAEKSWDQNLIT